MNKYKGDNLSERFVDFSVKTANLIISLPNNLIVNQIAKQLFRSAASIGANWEEAIGGLTKADFVHSVNIAKKEARETCYWLKVLFRTDKSNSDKTKNLEAECIELINILTSIVKNAQNKNSNLIILLFLVFYLLSLIPYPSNAADWPMFRGGPARTGYIAEQAAPPLVKEWEFQAPGGIVSSPAVYEGIVYFGTRAGKIYALNARTGVKLWERLTAGWVDSSPAVYGSAVYVTCLGGRLYALDRLNGEMLWIADIGAASASSPLIMAGRVYVGTGSPENRLKVYDAATGAQLASVAAGQPVDSAPSTDGSYVYFGGNDGRVYAVDALTLSARWPAYPTMGSFGHNAVAVSSGALYFLPGRDEKKAFILDAAAGSLTASSPPLASTGPWTQAGSPAVDEAGYVYFTAGAAETSQTGAQLAALSSGTLSAVWSSSSTLGGVSSVGILASPAVVNEVVYAATPGGRLIAVSSSGVLLADVDLSSPSYASPAVSNGIVIAANYGGKVFGFKAGRHAAVSDPSAGEVLNGTVSVKTYFNSPSLTGYELEYSTGGGVPQWVRISSAAVTSPSAGDELAKWNLEGLENGLYILRLRVLESPLSGYDGSASIKVRVNALPQPPSSLNAADVPGDTGNKIVLSWSASATQGVSYYKVYRDDGTGYVLYASTSGLSCVDQAAVTGSTFAYRVTAWDGWAESVSSGEVYAFSVNDSGDSVPPGSITDLSAEKGFSGGQVRLTWTAPGDDGDVGTVSFYLIRRSTDPAQNWSGFAQLAGGSRTADGAAGITESEDIGGLLAGATCYFAIKAVDDVGNEANISNIASAWAAYDTVPPAAPSGLSVWDVPEDEGGSLDLRWTLSTDDGSGAGDVYGYRIYRRTMNETFSSAPYASVGAGVSSYTDSAATLNVRYYYAVAAFDSTFNSPLSAEASGVSADNWRFFDSSRGGVARLSDGMEVEVPAGSASQNDKIVITRLDPLTYQTLFTVSAAPSANPTGGVYQVRFQNPVTKLNAPARITLPYSQADVAGMEEENLRIYALSGGIWKMVNTSSVSAEARKVSAEVSDFTFFRIMEYLPSGAVFADNEVYTYPNPATGDTVTFKFRLAYKSYVKIDVYNVAGEKVASLSRPDCPAGQASEIVWNAGRIAGGIYVYRMEAQSAAGSRSIIKKLAIAH